MRLSGGAKSAALGIAAWGIFVFTVAVGNNNPSSVDGPGVLIFFLIGAILGLIFAILGLIFAILAIRLGWRTFRGPVAGGSPRGLAVVGMVLGGTYLIFVVAGGLVGFLWGTLVGPSEPVILPTPVPAQTFPPPP